MEDLLYDYHVLQAMAKEQGGEQVDFKRTEYFLAVLKKYNVTQKDFDSSMVYYYSHLDRLKDIYLEVNERMEDEAKQLGVSLSSTSKYSKYSATGDTANIWNSRTDLMLIPKPAMNRFDFTVNVDTTFQVGDSFTFQFMTEYLWQSGGRDALVCLVAKYEGDSIIQTTNHISVSGISQVYMPSNKDSKLKELRGFIYLTSSNDDGETARKMMFISEMQLIRFHNKVKKDDTNDQKPAEKTDSIKPVDNSGRKAPDSIRSGTGLRSRERNLSVDARIAIDGVAPRNNRPQRK